MSSASASGEGAVPAPDPAARGPFPREAGLLESVLGSERYLSVQLGALLASLAYARERRPPRRGRRRLAFRSRAERVHYRYALRLRDRRERHKERTPSPPSAGGAHFKTKRRNKCLRVK